MTISLGYQASKNRLTTTVSLDEEQSARLRTMAIEEREKLSPFVGRLIDQEWKRRSETTQLSEPTADLTLAS